MRPTPWKVFSRKNKDKAVQLIARDPYACLTIQGYRNGTENGYAMENYIDQLHSLIIFLESQADKPP